MPRTIVDAVWWMERNFDFVSLEREHLECEECGWSGSGYETDKGYEALPGAIDLYCPVCQNFLGEVTKGEERERSV